MVTAYLTALIERGIWIRRLAQPGRKVVLIRPFRDDFGAEVLNFDLAAAATEEEVTLLRSALAAHQLLLFRPGKAIAPDRHVELGAWFGTPVDNGSGRLWTVLQNEEAAGREKLPFHSDFTYTDAPIKVISLHATAVPSGGTSTSFTSGIHAWATLPPALQELLAPMTLHHRHVSAFAGSDLPEFNADHPVRLLHPHSGRPILFVTEHHAHRIKELPPERSAAVLSEIFDHMYSDANVYTHRWQLHDLIVWDNLALQHARREKADLKVGRRIMQRVAMSEVNFAELIRRAREQQSQRQLTINSRITT